MTTGGRSSDPPEGEPEVRVHTPLLLEVAAFEDVHAYLRLRRRVGVDAVVAEVRAREIVRVETLVKADLDRVVVLDPGQTRELLGLPVSRGGADLRRRVLREVHERVQVAQPVAQHLLGGEAGEVMGAEDLESALGRVVEGLFRGLVKLEVPVVGVIFVQQLVRSGLNDVAHVVSQFAE